MLPREHLQSLQKGRKKSVAGKGAPTGSENAPPAPLGAHYRRNQKYGKARRRKPSNQLSSDESLMNHSKILASLLPDEILYDLEDHSIRKYNVALLLGDVSGFTALCEKYNKTGKGGPSRLTEILNGFIGSMVQEILSANGDVLKFSGDAFLTWWKSSPEKSMQDVVNQAVECSLLIQKHYGRYETDVQVTLKVKLAIAAGQVFFSIIGDGKSNHYIIVGQPIFDVKVAENFCTSGDVMLSPTAWQYINIQDYEHSYMPDKEHIKVTALAPWKTMQVAPSYQTAEYGPHFSSSSMHTLQDISSREGSTDEMLVQRDLSRDLEDISPRNLYDRAEEYSLRPSVNEVKQMKEPLRPFIFPPVMAGVDMDEPMEYLTEMRQVVIMFVNVIVIRGDMERLIGVVDEAYQKVCSLVMDNKGCVNKVSMFDKDLMFLVIFGLRGYKHDLEGQSGLHCAAEVFQALNDIGDIQVVSIGVTTGMTYCGVVGHVLRREYTVIGIAVNKAARLMMAYPGKVTCDRETFLHSRLDAKHFTLQEPKKLKGLDDVGPIYEYKDSSLNEQDKHVVSRFPLLSRHKELLLFTNFIDQLIVRYNQKGSISRISVDPASMRKRHIPLPISVLLIRGDLRQGKSRLLDEMIYSTPKDIVQIHRIALSHHDRRAPYSCIQLVFHPVLGLSETSTVKEREDKLMHRLEDLRIPQLLCCLNNVFNISFDMTMEYLNYRDDQRAEILMTVLKKLIHKCFKKLWVIAIDDCEFIDEESWRLMPLLFEANFLFLVLALGQRRDISEKAGQACAMTRVRHLPLQPINKMYHAGLVCQMLDVMAIPPELEKEVNERSNGNPGWVESYLVSLLQAGGVTMHMATRGSLSKLGLVAPPIEMMVRQDLIDKGLQNKAKNPGELVQVCKLTPHFRMCDISEELSMNVMVIKIFDSLTSYEQTLLKNASILGETFPRKMVQALMPNPDNHQTSLAVKHLFEIHVLGCAEGDFNPASNFMPFQPRPINPNMDLGLHCSCLGIVIPNSCKDLPAYASCGFMRFHTTLFRETTNNLLTNVQKKEVHLRAIKYLELETMRCYSCGGGPFHNILGNTRKPDDEVHARGSISSSKKPLLNGTSRTDEPRTCQNPKQRDRGLSSALKSQSVSQIKREEQWFENYLQPNQDGHTDETRTSETPQRESQMRCCGVKSTAAKSMIFDGSHSVMALTRSFSSENFSNCRCSLILSTMYAQMLEHCHGAGDVVTLMDALLEYAAVSIAAANIPQASRLLDEALQLLEGKTHAQRLEEDYDAIPDWQAPFIKGKIHTLMGSAQIVLGQLDTAYKRLYLAMLEFGKTFPTESFQVKFACKYQMVKLRLILQYFPQIYIGRTHGLKATMSEHIAECLSLLFTLFKIHKQWQLANLSAVWGLNIALQTNRNFFGLCTAYSNMLDVAHHFGNVHISWLIENASTKICNRVVTVQQQELEAVARLYYAMFKSRLHRGELDPGTSLGFKTLRISCSVHAQHIRLRMLPPLIQVLAMQRRISEAVLLLQELQFVEKDDTDKSALTWYNALAIEIQLDTGFCVVPFKQSEKFYQEGGENINTVRDPNSRTRFFINMWLWCVRLEEWEAAALWEPHARNEHPRVSLDDSIETVMTALRFLEVLLLQLVGKVNGRNVKALATMHQDIISLIRSLKKATNVCRLAIPRFMHLQAYYRQLRYNDSKAIKWLLEAKQTAQKHGNTQEIAWIEHSEKVWKSQLPPILHDVWKEQCDPENLMDWHEAEMSGKFAVFTLPLTHFSLSV